MISKWQGPQATKPQLNSFGSAILLSPGAPTALEGYDHHLEFTHLHIRRFDQRLW